MLVLSNSVKTLNCLSLGTSIEPNTTDALNTASHIIASDRKWYSGSNFFGYQAMEQISQ